jgi:hypothetical protein
MIQMSQNGRINQDNKRFTEIHHFFKEREKCKNAIENSKQRDIQKFIGYLIGLRTSQRENQAISLRS